MKRNLGLWVAMAIVGATLVSAPMKAIAQQDPRNQIIPSLELEGADIRDALKILFRTVNVNYTIASDVQGTVTVSLKDVPFETALRGILNQVGATYRMEGGIYVIVKREEPANIVDTSGGGAGVQPRAENRERRIYIKHADPALIIELISRSFSTNTQMNPESSTLVGGNSGFGGGFGGGGFGGGGFGGGNQFGGGGFGGGGFGGGGFGGGGFGGGGRGGPSRGG